MSLKGHCYLSLRQFSEAEKNYSYALESYDKPKCMHLLYINSAKVIKDVQKSRKLLLTACENDPTPYTWMACGILYFQVRPKSGFFHSSWFSSHQKTFFLRL